MRVLLADAIHPSTVGILTERGHECVFEPKLSSDELPGRMPGSQALVVRSTEVTAAAIEAADALELIVRAGAGTNTIDVEAASEVGIYVTNVPGRNAIAVAELTMGLLLAIDRRIPDNVADLRAGTWNKSTYGKADGLFGKVMGIVGLGDIGFAVAERAGRVRHVPSSGAEGSGRGGRGADQGARDRARRLARRARGDLGRDLDPRAVLPGDGVDVRCPGPRTR